MTNELSQMCINGVDYELKDSVARQNMIAVTDAKVGQTIKIAEVDSEGAPTKWAAANVSGGGCEVAVDGKALVISNSGESTNEMFELIRTVEIQESDLLAVHINTDTNDKPFTLKALHARIYCPESEKSVNGYIRCHADEEAKIRIAAAIAGGMSNTTEKITTYMAYPIFDLWHSLMYGSAQDDANSSSVYCYPIMQGRYSTKDYPYIRHVTVAQTAAFTSGTIIEIWGVRA